MKKKLVSAICAISLIIPLTLSAYAETSPSDVSAGSQAVVIDLPESTDTEAESDTQAVVETVDSDKEGSDVSSSETSEIEETQALEQETSETVEETEAEDVDLDDPQYWKEMKKQYGISTLSAIPQDYKHNSKFADRAVRFGVDVSSYQEDIDWAKAKADGVEFAFIRAGYRGWGQAGRLGRDTYAVKNLQAARAQGIQVGVYIYSQATTTDEAIEEANLVKQVIGNEALDLPMVFDFEYAYVGNGEGGRLYDAHLSRQAATDICMAFCDRANALGYDAMVYANKSMLTNNLNASVISAQYPIWLAHYTTQTSYEGDYDFWQYSDAIEVDGITGDVDGDFWYDTNPDSYIVSLNAYTEPQCLEAGESFSVQGKITSGLPIQSVTVGVYDRNNHQVTGATAYPGTYAYDLSELDASVKVSSLSGGMYHYKVIVKDSEGEFDLLDKIFSVRTNVATIKDGVYLITSAQNQNKTLSVDNNKNTSGTNILLWNRAEIPYRQFQFAYQGNGYYTIKNMGSGLYLSVAGQGSKSGTNVEQSSKATLWQVLSDGAGGYYIVPDCSSTSCLDLYTGKPENGKNIEIWNYNMRGSQRWYLASTSVKPTISGQSTPSNMKQGASFSIRGTVSASQTITSLTVGVYDTNGKMKIGKTVQPNANKYDLKNVDTSIKFGSLSTGGYRYKVTVTTASGTYTLVDKIFMVLSSGRTVANGTYRIVLSQNTNYTISVDHNRNTSGTNLLLWRNSNIAYRRFKFTYQNDGYYTIKNEGSGLYLSVKGQNSASGSNVELSSTATLWQVVSDGTGSYYLVPKCSSTSALDMYSGIPANGKNIEIWNYNLGKAQRWTLVK